MPISLRIKKKTLNMQFEVRNSIEYKLFLNGGESLFFLAILHI